MGKSFSDIKGGDLEGQMKLHRGEKPELPPKTAKAEEGEQSPSDVEHALTQHLDVEHVILQICLSYNHKRNIPKGVQAKMFGNQLAIWLEENIRILESKGIYLDNLKIDSDFDYEFEENKGDA